MIRMILFLVALLGVSLPANAATMSYEGSGTFDDGGTITMGFDFDGTSPSSLLNFSAITTAGSVFSGITDNSYTLGSFINTGAGAFSFNASSNLLSLAGNLIFSPDYSAFIAEVIELVDASTKRDTSFIGGIIVSDVPIPAAAWLFGSAILGLFGAARRKQA